MISRRLLSGLVEDLTYWPAVALLGPRQVGKTTLAHALVDSVGQPAHFFDLERPEHRVLFEEPVSFLEKRVGALIVIDEVQRAPHLFEALRVVIDARRAAGENAGQFLLLGSASGELSRQTSESLAGRIAYRELTPFLPDEQTGLELAALWLRGGFPESALAPSDRRSLAWREAFLRTYLERDLPQLGVRVAAETLRRFCTMLAHLQGSLLNASRLAASLAVSGKTVTQWVDRFVDALLVRRLSPWHANLGKRLVRAPKIYVRDAGLVHALLGIESPEQLLSHPVAGPSWEGFVIEALIAAAGERCRPWFYRTAAGAEIDLVVERAGRLWAFEIKRSSTPRVERGFQVAADDLQVERRFLVYPGAEPYRTAGGVEVIGLAAAMAELRGRT